MDIGQTPAGAARPASGRVSFRWTSALLATACGATGIALAMHYPVAPIAITLLFMACVAAFYVWQDAWLFALPAALPIVGFAPWTGWMTFEELDLLVLAAAAAGHAHRAIRHKRASRRRAAGMSPLPLLLTGLFASSTLLAMYRGFEDAGGFAFGWFQGYHEPMNSLRVAKPLFLALVLLPLWRAASGRDPTAAASRLAAGLAGGLVAAALATIWERVAFVGLMNFSTDYRTTGLFWEMHVGGAALDGFLALTMPFAVRELVSARSPLRWSLAAAAVALGGYACLTTFSRGVYLAIPVGIAVCALLGMLQTRRATARRADRTTADKAAIGAGLLWVAGFAAATLWTFPHSGYRGLGALLGAAAIALPLAGVLRGFKVNDWISSLGAGGLFCLIALACAMLVPKGAYLACIAALLASGGLAGWCVWSSRHPDTTRVKAAPRLAGPLAFASFLALLVGVTAVAEHWGGSVAMFHMLPVLALLLGTVVAAGSTRRALWPAQPRWQGTVLGTMLMVSGLLAVLGGGAYMTERFSTGGQDLDGRVLHWRQGFEMLSTTADVALGKGMGRYPAGHFFAATTTEPPGDYRLVSEAGYTYLSLGGGKHEMGWGELLRVSQRILPPGGPVVVHLQVRAAKPVGLHLEVCEKHLLYNGGCLLKAVDIAPLSGQWQTLRVPLDGDPLTGGPWYAPRLVAFSVATASRQGLLEVRNIDLVGAGGRHLLDNGDFSQGLQRWFFSSDRNHMPWHIKSMFMNVLFDQGFVGLALWLMLGAVALWRLGGGHARDHALAPGVAGALAGFAVVGLFDSLLDVPRVATLFYLLLLLGLTLRPAPKSGAGASVSTPEAAKLGRH